MFRSRGDRLVARPLRSYSAPRSRTRTFQEDKLKLTWLVSHTECGPAIHSTVLTKR